MAGQQSVMNKKLDELEAKLSATKKELGQKIEDSRKGIVNDIAEFMEKSLFPMIEEKADKTDIERLERRLDHLADKIGEHDVKLKKIESTSVATH